jgi:hypothetical protein
MGKIFSLDLPSGSTVPAVRITGSATLPAILAAWGLRPPRPTLVIVGGANSMSVLDQDRLWPLFLEGLAPLVDRLGAAIVDGGTDAGVMRLMGRARQEMQGMFPLLGVVPEALLALPGRALAGNRGAPPARYHTHFVLVPGTSWGASAPQLAAVATALAATAPSVTLVINGGAITLQDAIYSTEAGRAVLTVAGSGRVADDLASALQGSSRSVEAAQVAASGLLQAVDLSAGPGAISDALRRILVPSEQPDLLYK